MNLGLKRVTLSGYCSMIKWDFRSPYKSIDGKKHWFFYKYYDISKEKADLVGIWGNGFGDFFEKPFRPAKVLKTDCILA
jgi:hypothetical protein